MERSLVKIIKALEDFATAHQQIETFMSKPLTEVSSKGIKYPLMFLDVQGMNASFARGQVVITAPIYFLDRIERDYSNLVAVMSSCLLKVDDFLTYFYDKECDLKFSLQVQGSATPVVYEFDDLCCGWSLTCAIQTGMSRNESSIPIN